jgi:hypothetical protein
MSRRAIILGLLAAGLAAAGCHTCKRQEFTSNRPGCGNCGDGSVPPRLKAVPTPLPPFRQPPAQPPIASIGGPTPAQHLEPQDKAPAPSNEPSPTPPAPGDFPPADPDVRLLPPRLPSPYRREVAKPWPDDNEPKANVPGPAPKDQDKTAPKDDNTARLLNVKQATADVSSGLKPFDVSDVRWLQKKGYAAVLYLHDPATDDTVDRRVSQKAGMAYHGLVASPARLDRKLYEQFVKLVEDKDNHPLYVYDKDGTVAGGLWYLYFHLHKGDSDEDARAKAKKLGLDFEDDNEPHKTMVTAVQVFVGTYKP